MAVTKRGSTCCRRSVAHEARHTTLVSKLLPLPLPPLYICSSRFPIYHFITKKKKIQLILFALRFRSRAQKNKKKTKQNPNLIIETLKLEMIVGQKMVAEAEAEIMYPVMEVNCHLRVPSTEYSSSPPSTDISTFDSVSLRVSSIPSFFIYFLCDYWFVCMIVFVGAFLIFPSLGFAWRFLLLWFSKQDFSLEKFTWVFCRIRIQ